MLKTGNLAVRGITKAYPGTVALRDFSSAFEGGKVHALIGKNGSGKSTFIKILAGAEYPDEGEILLDGRRLVLSSPQDAFREGIVTVYQELSLVPGLTVAENIFLGRWPHSGGLVDWRRMRHETRQILDSLKVDVSETAMTRTLSVGRQQMVEIARAMSLEPSVLLLDEPTSALAKHETQSLFTLIRTLRQRGVTIIYITHRMHELPQIVDDVTVLRDGKCTGVLAIDEATPERIVDRMYGPVEIRHRPATLSPGDATVMSVHDLSREPFFRGLSFDLKEGEILGIAGMLGSGRSELLRAIFGADARDGGEIRIQGRAVPFRSSPALMKNLGLAMTPENRKEEGLVQPLSVRANMSMAAIKRIGRHGFITRRAESDVAQQQVEALDIKTASLESPVSSLSGGNQQKVVVGNWLNNNPSIVFFDEPTRGIDVHAKQQIFQIMWELSRQGLSVIFVSTELEELIEVCHRLLVMRNGAFVAQKDASSCRLDELYALCMGDESLDKEKLCR